MCRSFSYFFTLLCPVVFFLTSVPAAAQQQSDDDVVAAPLLAPPSKPAAPTQGGRIGDAGNGQVGQRQTRSEVLSARPRGRVANRVQNRLRNRIDRFYDPRANATAPFRVASEQARNSRR